MAYQLSTVRTRVQAKLDNTAFDQTKLTQFVNDGQRDLFGAFKFPFMEKEGTLTVTSGNSQPTGLPADFQTSLYLRRYTPAALAGSMDYIEYEDFDERYPNPTVAPNGTPTLWYVFSNVINTFPAADQTYTFKLKYIKKPAELVNDTDVPEWPEEYSEILVLAAYKRALMHDDNFDQAQVVQQDIDAASLNTVLRLGKRTAGQVKVMRSPRNLRQNRVTGRI